MSDTVAKRFWDKVDRNGPIPDHRPSLGRCWVWKAQRIWNGYGHFSRDGQKELAHRVAFELSVGPIPDGLTLDHLCRNRACVRPTHLEPVSMKENILRGNGRAARNARKTHCKHGHEFTAENTHYFADGKRGCLVCRRQYDKTRFSTPESWAQRAAYMRQWHARRKAGRTL